MISPPWFTREIPTYTIIFIPIKMFSICKFNPFLIFLISTITVSLIITKTFFIQQIPKNSGYRLCYLIVLHI